ncbi:hypothetical protein E4U55_007507 [Claviceps digitariae]|nr:hypothetical protein E4U55_007507 [Claviceps digitariae]
MAQVPDICLHTPTPLVLTSFLGLSAKLLQIYEARNDDSCVGCYLGAWLIVFKLGGSWELGSGGLTGGGGTRGNDIKVIH